MDGKTGRLLDLSISALVALLVGWAIPAIVGIAAMAPTPAHGQGGCTYHVGPEGQGDWVDCPNTPSPSSAHYASIAVSDSTLNWGTSWGYASRAGAEQAALARCRKRARDCHSSVWGQNQCLALATSKDGAWGADYGSYPETASRKALQRCNSVSKGPCTVQTHPCSED